ncbi:MAG TPA: hypothetical protein VJX10_05905, partial [Pseudonocardiaceae bacterium]|nr:hypothetical protein [Pseudonocardiaceae bacterium]
MVIIGLGAAVLAGTFGVLYGVSFGVLVAIESVRRRRRRRHRLAAATLRIHQLLAEAGHPPVRRRVFGGGRHRVATQRFRPTRPAGSIDPEPPIRRAAPAMAMAGATPDHARHEPIRRPNAVPGRRSESMPAIALIPPATPTDPASARQVLAHALAERRTTEPIPHPEPARPAAFPSRWPDP